MIVKNFKKNEHGDRRACDIKTLLGVRSARQRVLVVIVTRMDPSGNLETNPV